MSHEPVRWRAKWEVAHYDGDVDAYIAEFGRELGIEKFLSERDPTDVFTAEDNLLMYGGASCLWQCLIGNGTGTAAQTLTYFNNGNAYIGVGDSSTSEAATHTDLQAASNKIRKGMDATYPQHTDATTSGAASIIYRCTLGTSEGNFAINEVALFNGSSGGRMLNRKVSSLGTKTSASSATVTLTLTLA